MSNEPMTDDQCEQWTRSGRCRNKAVDTMPPKYAHGYTTALCKKHAAAWKRTVKAEYARLVWALGEDR